ncbi:FMN-binding protein [Fusobacterium sp. CM22]|uniref:FMN-binding protein n=1 Tax=Fusobacterium sp. CM22 TaxID=936563 RepID=UPI00044792C7|nr:FMN-binding protein [Fusobacterium sp. CM22]EUB20707.1 FMN-binding domain protein [Fusobacterium sp. CM22]
MNFKDFGIREWLVIVFIILGLAAFAFEDVFKPKIYQAEGTGIGYNDDITLKVSAYKKKDKTIRVTDIQVEHADTDEIGGVAVQKLIDDIKARQKFEDFDFVAGATFTSEGFKEALTMAIDDIKNQE